MVMVVGRGGVPGDGRDEAGEAHPAVRAQALRVGEDRQSRPGQCPVCAGNVSVVQLQKTLSEDVKFRAIAKDSFIRT